MKNVKEMNFAQIEAYVAEIERENVNSKELVKNLNTELNAQTRIPTTGFNIPIAEMKKFATALKKVTAVGVEFQERGFLDEDLNVILSDNKSGFIDKFDDAVEPVEDLSEKVEAHVNAETIDMLETPVIEPGVPVEEVEEAPEVEFDLGLQFNELKLDL